MTSEPLGESRPAFRSAPPERAIFGAPSPSAEISISCQPIRPVMPVPSAVAQASLAAKRRAKKPSASRRLLPASISFAVNNRSKYPAPRRPVCLRRMDNQDHGNSSPGFAMPGTEVIFPLSPKVALRGRFDGEEDVIQADKETVAGINSPLISNCHDQVFGRDALFRYKRGPKDEIGGGPHLDTDETFLAGGRDVKTGKIVALTSD
jgi:hypothetical protein